VITHREAGFTFHDDLLPWIASPKFAGSKT
jgi:hypothetical protein